MAVAAVLLWDGVGRLPASATNWGARADRRGSPGSLGSFAKHLAAIGHREPSGSAGHRLAAGHAGLAADHSGGPTGMRGGRVCHISLMSSGVRP